MNREQVESMGLEANKIEKSGMNKKVIKIILYCSLIFICSCGDPFDIEWLIPSNIQAVQIDDLENLGFSRVAIDVPMYELETEKGNYALQLSNIKDGTCLYQFWTPNVKITNFLELNKYIKNNKLRILNHCPDSSEPIYVIHQDARAIYKVIPGYEKEEVTFIYESPRFIYFKY